MYYISEEILSLAYNVHTTPEELKKSLDHFGFVFGPWTMDTTTQGRCFQI